MKRVVTIMMVVLATFLSGCMKLAESPEVNISPAVSIAADQTSEVKLSDTATSMPTVSPSPAVSEDDTDLDDNGDDDYPPVDPNIPGLLGNKWYDWDKVGAYPGASVVGYGKRIAYQKIKSAEDSTCDYYLSFANPNGEHSVRTNIEDSNCINYKDGWFYIIYEDKYVYKVKANGSGLKRIYKAESSIKGTTDISLSDMLLIGDKLYVFERIGYGDGDKEKSFLLRMNLNGSGREKLDEMDSFGYGFSPFYDSGKLYYIDANIDKYLFSLYQYDITSNKKISLAKDLSADYSKIAVRKDKVYYANDGMLYVYTISTGKEEEFSGSKGFDVYDFGFFDRWMLITSGEGLLCYDLTDEKLYCAGGSGNELDVVPTQNSLYLEDEEYGMLYTVTFKDGKVIIGDDFNVIE